MVQLLASFASFRAARLQQEPRTNMGADAFNEVPDLGKNPGLWVWRIEKLQPVLKPNTSTGKFHTGDSYIVLSCFLVKNSMRMHIHFWLGSESSQDERGAAVSPAHSPLRRFFVSRVAICGSAVAWLPFRRVLTVTNCTRFTGNPHSRA